MAPDRPMPYWGWGVLPDPYGRLWDGDDGESPVPAPPTAQWPWANAPRATIATMHCPGQYTLTVDLDPHADHDDLDDLAAHHNLR